MPAIVPLAPTDRRRYSFFASGMRGRGKYTAALRLRKFACASSQSFISWTWSIVEGMSTRKNARRSPQYLIAAFTTLVISVSVSSAARGMHRMLKMSA